MTSRAHISVDKISPSERLPLWHHLVSKHLGQMPESARECDPGQWDPTGTGPFSGSLECGVLGGASLCRLIATPHRFIRPYSQKTEDLRSPLMLVMQQKGSSFFEQNSRNGTLEPGDWCLLDTAKPFALHNPSGCDQIIFTPPRPSDPSLVDLIARASARRCDIHSGSSRLVQTMLAEAFRQFDRLPTYAAKTLVDAISDLAWHAMQEQTVVPEKNTPQDTHRNRLKDFIETNLAEPNLSLEMIAQGCACSVRSLHRAFADDPVGSVTDYIWHRRVTQCASALKDPGNHARSITDIAMSWGFSSSSHFSRVFKSSFGASPKAYRAR
nr:helix-turn-helix domain-containing protein [uncultured Albidiferax sp.]